MSRGTNDLENKSYPLDARYTPMVNLRPSMKCTLAPSSVGRYNLGHNLAVYLVGIAPNVSYHAKLAKIQDHVCAIELRCPAHLYQKLERSNLSYMFDKVADSRGSIIFSILLSMSRQRDTMSRCSIVWEAFQMI